MSMFLFSIWTLTVPRTLNSLWKGARHAAEPGGRLSPRRPLLSSRRDVPRLRRSRAAPGESAAEGLSETTRNGIRETCPEPGAPQGAPPPAVRAGARVLPGRASRTCGAGAPRCPSSRRPRARKCLGLDGPGCERRWDNDHSGGGDADVYLAETARPALPGRFTRGTPKSPRTAPALSPPRRRRGRPGPRRCRQPSLSPLSPAAPSRVAPPRPLRQPSAPRVRLALDGRTGQPRPRGLPQVQCCRSCSRAPLTPRSSRRSSRREPGVLSRPPEPASFLRSLSTRATCSSRCSRTCHGL